MNPRTPEERFERMERSMEFLLQQQARFDSNQGRFDANLARLEEQTARNAEQISLHSTQIGQLAGLTIYIKTDINRP